MYGVGVDRRSGRYDGRIFLTRKQSHWWWPSSSGTGHELAADRDDARVSALLAVVWALIRVAGRTGERLTSGVDMPGDVAAALLLIPVVAVSAIAVCRSWGVLAITPSVAPIRLIVADALLDGDQAQSSGTRTTATRTATVKHFDRPCGVLPPRQPRSCFGNEQIHWPAPHRPDPEEWVLGQVEPARPYKSRQRR